MSGVLNLTSASTGLPDGQLLLTSATLVLRQELDGALKPFVDVREIAPNGLNEKLSSMGTTTSDVNDPVST
jgi:hypothetical protein